MPAMSKIFVKVQLSKRSNLLHWL